MQLQDQYQRHTDRDPGGNLVARDGLPGIDRYATRIHSLDRHNPPSISDMAVLVPADDRGTIAVPDRMLHNPRLSNGHPDVGRQHPLMFDDLNLLAPKF